MCFQRNEGLEQGRGRHGLEAAPAQPNKGYRDVLGQQLCPSLRGGLHEWVGREPGADTSAGVVACGKS